MAKGDGDPEELHLDPGGGDAVVVKVGGEAVRDDLFEYRDEGGYQVFEGGGVDGGDGADDVYGGNQDGGIPVTEDKAEFINTRGVYTAPPTASMFTV